MKAKQLSRLDIIKQKYFRVGRCSQCIWYVGISHGKGRCELFNVIVSSDADSCEFFNMSLEQAKKHGLDEYLKELQKYRSKLLAITEEIFNSKKVRKKRRKKK